MAESDGVKEALAILGIIRGGGVDLTGVAKGANGMSPQELMARGLLQSGMGTGLRPPTGPPPSSPLGLDDALPLALGTAGELVGRRVPVPGASLGLGALGAGAGRALNQPLYSLFGGTAPSPTGSRIGDVMLEMGGQTFGNLLGRGLAKVGGTSAGAVTPAPDPAAGATRNAFNATGVDLRLSDVSPNMSALERSVAQTPTGGNIIRGSQDKRAAQHMRAADEWLNTLAPAQARERVAVGEKVSDSVTRNLKQTGALEDTLWTQLGHQANDVPVQMTNLRAYADDALRTELQGKEPNKEVVSFLRRIIDSGETWAWQAADATRKQYGREIGGDRSLISQVPAGTYRGAYGAMLRDMEAAAAQVPGLEQAFSNVRKFSENRRAIFRDGEVAKILETDPENVVKTLRLAGGPSAIKRAREAITGNGTPTPQDQQAWDYVRRHIMEGVFTQATNHEFKGLTNPVIVGKRLDDALKTIGKDGLKELLSDTERAALDNLVAVAKSLRQSERIGAMPGTSATAQAMGFKEYMTSPGTLLGGAVGGLLGGPAGAATGAAAGGYAAFVLVPHVAAKILTNPKLAKIVATPAFRGLADISRVGASAAKEGTVALSRLFGEITAEQLGGRQP